MVNLRQNQYQGINAHLHSFMQQEDCGWEVFHAAHIIHLAEAIDALLPEGYIVDPEKGMQTQEYHPDSGEPISPKWKPKPDLTIYDYGSAPSSTTPVSSATPILTLAAEDSIELDDESFMTALVVKEITAQGKTGKPVTWIELLSPGNKPYRSGYWQYREKRIATVQNGIALVEIDYLHETRSVLPKLPLYPDDKSAFPYTIAITNPRPSLKTGKLEIYGFHVDDPIPTVAIPLLDDNFIVVEMNTVYNRTFSSLGSFSVRVDYQQLPINFDRYHPTDQERIKSRMDAITIEIQSKS